MLYAPVVKLADTIDLGSIASGVQVQVLSGAPDEFLSTHSRYEELFYLILSLRPKNKSREINDPV